MLPYGKQTIEPDDVAAVLEVLQSDWLTTGPMVGKLESEFADAVDAKSAVAVNSGTAALHTAMFGAGIGAAFDRPNNEVIVPAISFVATANAALYAGATPVFADVGADDLLIDPDDVIRKITPQTKAIVAVDYAGQPCDYDRLRRIADAHNLVLIADACHSLGAEYHSQKVGSVADFSCFSLHPVKPITSGEGGIVTTNNVLAAHQMRTFRNHGITTDHRQRQQKAQHRYTMQSLGFNYRLTDIQCALALSQLNKLHRFNDRRREVATLYDQLLEDIPYIKPLATRPSVCHAYHLYVIRWNENETGLSRDDAFHAMREQGIGVNVHYQPIYQQPFYQQLMPTTEHACPVAEQVYLQILSLPVFPKITDDEVRFVVQSLEKVANQQNTRAAA